MAGVNRSRQVDRPVDDLLLCALALAYDTVLGEPPARLHPVVGMGAVARWLEGRAPSHGRAAQLVYGGALALAPPAVYATLTALLLRGVRRAGRMPYLLVGAPLLKSTFAARELRGAAAIVRVALEVGDLAAARAGLRALVSRDTVGLAPHLLAAAAIESLAENLADAVVAPLLCYGVWGVPGAVAYRAVNTLDAMVGYRGRYEWLGKAGARLDDLCNIVPARLTAGLLVVAAWVAGEDSRGAWRVLWRDGGGTTSPNAGWPMAAMAGALGVELEKVGHYRLGAGLPPPAAAALARADRLVGLATALAAALTLAVRSVRRADRTPRGARR